MKSPRVVSTVCLVVVLLLVGHAFAGGGHGSASDTRSSVEQAGKRGVMVELVTLGGLIKTDEGIRLGLVLLLCFAVYLFYRVTNRFATLAPAATQSTPMEKHHAEKEDKNITPTRSSDRQSPAEGHASSYQGAMNKWAINLPDTIAAMVEEIRKRHHLHTREEALIAAIRGFYALGP
jgi:hypothetical protein